MTSLLAKERLWNNDLKGLITGILPDFRRVVNYIEKLMKFGEVVLAWN